MGIGLEGLGVLAIILVLALIAVFLWLSARILSRAGYSSWWSLVSLIPVVGIIMWYVFAFSTWPNEKNSSS